MRFNNPEMYNSAVSKVLHQLGASPIGVMNVQGAITFAISPTQNPYRAAALIRGVPGVAASSPIFQRYTLSTTPNDQEYLAGHQWDMNIIHMPDAWSITEGSPTVKIAVIDTGYDAQNQDLTGKVTQSIVFDKGTGQADAAATAQDNDGHGTNVSGIAAADTNNTIDVAGTGWNVGLLEARVFPLDTTINGCPSAASNDVGAAIDWAVSNGANVINLSLGSDQADPVSEEPAVARAIAHGVIVVAAAGNGNASKVGQPTLVFPGADIGVISVGASALHDIAPNTLAGGTEYVASYSNYGNANEPLDVVAPGGDPSTQQTNCNSRSCIDYLQWILNLYTTTAISGGGSQLALFAGTSQATPHVSGLAALMVSKAMAGGRSLTPAQARQIIDATADNIGDAKQGHGRINAFHALQQTP
ncbi:MAG: S8 family serine peptidase [Candidatus Eremiobacteraeota bacterium]|nr:S8 family serine peptidase [Candidatus Eremiobacteraeota bacterium]